MFLIDRELEREQTCSEKYKLGKYLCAPAVFKNISTSISWMTSSRRKKSIKHFLTIFFIYLKTTLIRVCCLDKIFG